MLVTALIAVNALLFVYFFIVRPLLKAQPALAPMFKAEASFADKARAKLVGWRTKIVARMVVIAGLLTGLYGDLLPLVAGQDWSPLTSQVPAWVIPVGLVALGYVFERLRKITENPPQLVTEVVDATGVPKVVDVIKPGA